MCGRCVVVWLCSCVVVVLVVWSLYWFCGRFGDREWDGNAGVVAAVMIV